MYQDTEEAFSHNLGNATEGETSGKLNFTPSTLEHNKKQETMEDYRNDAKTSHKYGEQQLSDRNNGQFLASKEAPIASSYYYDDQIVRKMFRIILSSSLIDSALVPRPFVLSLCQSNQINLRSAQAVEGVTWAVKNGGLLLARSNPVVFAFNMSFASQHLSSLGGWDEARRQTVRRVLAEARSNFHVHPRPW